MTGLEIRRYREADHPEVARVWYESALSSWSGEVPPNLRRELFERIPRELASGGWSLYVATTEHERIVAMLVLEPMERCLRQLFVDPEFQNRGIGKALLDFARAQMPSGFWLTTSAENQGGKRFYAREGLFHRYERPHPDHPQSIHATFDWSPNASREELMAKYKSRLRSIEADITTLSLDAIVNAANEPLLMGGGVDGAIRRQAGPQMEADLRRIGRCPEGTAVITRAYRLPSQWTIHTVAPVWNGGDERSKETLASCYRSSLALARDRGLSSIAFPCIGTGIFGWPADIAAEIAFAAVMRHVGASDVPSLITFCCFSAADRERYQSLIETLSS
jgi:O-acetyl-ADP-ribose deacetylase (regulator of RNase III)/GNAT superfamily N-acetyltransferase